MRKRITYDEAESIVKAYEELNGSSTSKDTLKNYLLHDFRLYLVLTFNGPSQLKFV